jgi:hypothetical protein
MNPMRWHAVPTCFPIYTTIGAGHNLPTSSFLTEKPEMNYNGFAAAVQACPQMRTIIFAPLT